MVRVTGLEIAPDAFTKKREMPKTRTITGFVAGVPVAGFHRISQVFAGFPMNNAQIMPKKNEWDAEGVLFSIINSDWMNNTKVILN